MHRASVLSDGPYFIGGERNLSTKEGRLFVWYVLFVGFAYKGKDIVFGFIIEYSSLRDFGPSVIGLFLYEDF
jgi:hypothetical protein